VESTASSGVGGSDGDVFLTIEDMRDAFSSGFGVVLSPVLIHTPSLLSRLLSLLV
jgi:hypothetical protein